MDYQEKSPKFIVFRLLLASMSSYGFCYKQNFYIIAETSHHMLSGTHLLWNRDGRFVTFFYQMVRNQGIEIESEYPMMRNGKVERVGQGATGFQGRKLFLYCFLIELCIWYTINMYLMRGVKYSHIRPFNLTVPLLMSLRCFSFLKHLEEAGF